MYKAIIDEGYVYINGIEQSYEAMIEYDLEVETRRWGVKSIWPHIHTIDCAKIKIVNGVDGWDIEAPMFDNDQLFFDIMEIDLDQKTVTFN